jgi:hypothetical protein
MTPWIQAGDGPFDTEAAPEKPKEKPEEKPKEEPKEEPKEKPKEKPKAEIDEGCKLLTSAFADASVKEMRPCRRGLSKFGNFGEKGGWEMKQAYHMGVLATFNDGSHLLIEKFGEGKHGTIHGEVVNPPGKDGKFRASDGEEYSLIETMISRPNVSETIIPVTGKQLMDSILTHDEEYGMCNSNCHHFATDVCRDFGISVPEVHNGKLWVPFLAYMDLVIAGFVDGCAETNEQRKAHEAATRARMIEKRRRR